jgi:hypothetical protein
MSSITGKTGAFLICLLLRVDILAVVLFQFFAEMDGSFIEFDSQLYWKL